MRHADERECEQVMQRVTRNFLELARTRRHQQVVAGWLNPLITSGQIAIDPANGALIEGGIAEQTARVFQNLAAVLAGAGLDLADVVKTTVFLIDMNDFGEMNRVYAEQFNGHLPARSTVAVAGLPKGGRVEIEVVAIGRDL
jgi:2-iminobutanoate/2-iminopropanoate deaminase